MTAVNASTTGTFLDDGTPSANQAKILNGVVLAAGSAADATVTVKETDTNGRLLVSLAAAMKTTEQCAIPIDFKGKVYVTVSGAGATVILYQR